MKKVCLSWLLLMSISVADAQSVVQRIGKAMQAMLNDPQLKFSSVGFYVIDMKTGKAVYSHDAFTGLAAASTQKLFTSAAAFDLLGSSFRFKTEIGYRGTILNDVLKGDLVITGYGDPTLGSWRWNETKAQSVFSKILSALKSKGISGIEGRIIIDNSHYSIQPLPEGWIWQDIGNYYGAGCWAVNWHENQYDLRLQSGTLEGQPTTIISIEPELKNVTFHNNILTGKKGSGDNAYIYLAPNSSAAFATGTIPAGESNFLISGSFPNGPKVMVNELNKVLAAAGIRAIQADSVQYSRNANTKTPEPLLTIHSPTLDSINYWFLRKSVNLYGEALAKMFAFTTEGIGDTEKGLNVIKNHWSKLGIDAGEVNIMDGSGLSPQNRVTPHALVQVLKHARSRPWYSSFYHSLPEYNGMKMKSGSIGGARAYAGYHRSKAGNEYAFAIIVNNYSGSAGTVTRKMFAVLDELK